MPEFPQKVIKSLLKSRRNVDFLHVFRLAADGEREPMVRGQRLGLFAAPGALGGLLGEAATAPECHDAAPAIGTKTGGGGVESATPRGAQRGAEQSPQPGAFAISTVLIQF